MKSLTKEQAIIITGFTGLMTCPFSCFHGDVEKRLGRPVFTHEFATEKMWEEIKQLYTEDFIKLCYKGENK